MTDKLGLNVVAPPTDSWQRLQPRLNHRPRRLRAGAVAACCVAITLAVAFLVDAGHEPSLPGLAQTYLAHRSTAIDPRTLHLHSGTAVMLSSSAAVTIYLVDIGE